MKNQSVPNPQNVTRATLDNGITVLIRENRAAPVITLDGYLTVGALHEPADKRGLSSFVAGMLTRGSTHYDFDTFNETIESVGGSLSAGSGTHTSGFGINCLSEDFPNLLQVLADVLRNPTFPQEHMDLIRSRKLVGMQQSALYGDHPYGHPISGYPETLMAIEHADLMAFHQQHYTPEGGVIVAVGDVETDALLDQLNQQLGQWQGVATDSTVPEITWPDGPQQIFHAIEDKVQSDIIIGFPAMNRSHPDFDAARVANTILGQFGMMGRLGERVREEQGLAYYCSSSLDVGSVAGVWSAMAGVNGANVEQASASILAEFARLDIDQHRAIRAGPGLSPALSRSDLWCDGGGSAAGGANLSGPREDGCGGSWLLTRVVLK